MKPVLSCDVVERCGGCPWLSVDAVVERSHKFSQVDLLLGNLGATGVVGEFFDSPSRLGYRNRVRLRIDDQGHICFFNSEKSPHCAALMPELHCFLAQVQQWALSHKDRLTSFAHVEARTYDADGRAGLYLTYHPNTESDDALVLELTEELSPALVSTNRHATSAAQRFAIYADTYTCVPLNGFIQVNPAVNRILVHQVVQTATCNGWQTFIDLYGGAGNFALPLTRLGIAGTLVERNRNCIRATSQATMAQGLAGLELHDRDSIELARTYLAEGRRFDAVIIDPPRAGVREGIKVISALSRRDIVYCSCNLETLARDLRVLCANGWSLQRVAGFDMFPGTRHLETVAWLNRNDE